MTGNDAQNVLTCCIFSSSPLHGDLTFECLSSIEDLFKTWLCSNVVSFVMKLTLGLSISQLLLFVSLSGYYVCFPVMSLLTAPISDPP